MFYFAFYRPWCSINSGVPVVSPFFLSLLFYPCNSISSIEYGIKCPGSTTIRRMLVGYILLLIVHLSYPHPTTVPRTEQLASAYSYSSVRSTMTFRRHLFPFRNPSLTTVRHYSIRTTVQYYYTSTTFVWVLYRIRVNNYPPPSPLLCGRRKQAKSVPWLLDGYY